MTNVAAPVTEVERRRALPGRWSARPFQVLRRVSRSSCLALAAIASSLATDRAGVAGAGPLRDRRSTDFFAPAAIVAAAVPCRPDRRADVHAVREVMQASARFVATLRSSRAPLPRSVVCPAGSARSRSSVGSFVIIGVRLGGALGPRLRTIALRRVRLGPIRFAAARHSPCRRWSRLRPRDSATRTPATRSTPASTPTRAGRRAGTSTRTSRGACATGGRGEHQRLERGRRRRRRRRRSREWRDLRWRR